MLQLVSHLGTLVSLTVTAFGEWTVEKVVGWARVKNQKDSQHDSLKKAVLASTLSFLATFP